MAGRVGIEPTPPFTVLSILAFIVPVNFS
jgi:hypothetical protein